MNIDNISEALQLKNKLEAEEKLLSNLMKGRDQEEPGYAVMYYRTEAAGYQRKENISLTETELMVVRDLVMARTGKEIVELRERIEAL